MKVDIRRRPTEDWGKYVSRLEAERLKVIGRNKEREAEALEDIPQEHQDIETKTTAKAQRAAAEEFYRAVEKIERGEE